MPVMRSTSCKSEDLDDLPRILLPIQAMLDVGSSISWEYLGLVDLFIAVHQSDLLRTPLCCDEFWCDLVEVD